MKMAASNQQMNDHDGHVKFSEMCALYSTGSLNRAEVAELDEHLSSCEVCRRRLAEYTKLVRYGMPLLAREKNLVATLDCDSELAETKVRLLANLRPRGSESFSHLSRWPVGRLASAWLNYWVPVALSLVLGVAGYVLGSQHSRNTLMSGSVQSANETKDEHVYSQLERAIRESEQLDLAIKARDEKLGFLSAERNRQSAYISKLEKMSEEAEVKATQATDDNAALKSDRDSIARQLHDAQLNLDGLNHQIEGLRTERIADLMQTADMKKRIDDLTAQSKIQQATISEQERLLAADRDVRELMGQRNLLIADVFDVDEKGRNRPAIGRVFYTKDQSLIFYAFDLDKQHGLRHASTFQAWGTRTTAQGKEEPINMGIFYMDNAANRRWALRFDDPKVLERIDAVFVTVEPSGGSDKPRGKQLLYAYLRGQPNHP